MALTDLFSDFGGAPGGASAGASCFSNSDMLEGLLYRSKIQKAMCPMRVETHDGMRWEKRQGLWWNDVRTMGEERKKGRKEGRGPEVVKISRWWETR